MTGVNTITNSTVVQPYLEPVWTAPLAALADIPSASASASSPAAYPLLPFKRLTLETMGLGMPLNFGDASALIKEIGLQLDAVMDKIRAAGIKGAGTQINAEFTKIFNGSSTIQSLTSEIAQLEAGVAVSQSELPALTESLAVAQATSSALAPAVEGAAAALQAATDAIAALDQTDPDFEANLAAAEYVRDDAAETLATLSQQKADADTQISALHQSIDALNDSIALQQRDLDDAQARYNTSLQAFATIFSSISSLGAKDRSSVGSEVSRTSLGESIALHLDEAAAKSADRMRQHADRADLNHELQEDTIISDRARQAFEALPAGLADVLSSLKHVRDVSQGQMEPGASAQARLLMAV